MTIEAAKEGGVEMTYQIEGRLLEVCNCEVLCPCWIGEDPDNATCEAVVGWKIDKGTVQGVDVSDLTLALLPHIPGNILEGNWKVVVLVDDRATPEQHEAMLKVFTGQLGGPAADFAQLVGEVVAVESAEITSTIDEGKGSLRIGPASSPIVEMEMDSYMGATGKATVLQETAFSTIPGSPAYVGKATKYKRNSSRYGLQDIDIENHNAVQGYFNFEVA